MDTAAVMRNLDLVITSDTAVAHLAGALGVPVWVALGRSCDWRWLDEREDSPWYPTMRLFRQERLGDWEGVFAAIAVELARVVRGEPATPIASPRAAGPALQAPLSRRRTSGPDYDLEGQAGEDGRGRRLPERRAGTAGVCRPSSGKWSAAVRHLDALVRGLQEVNEALWEIEDEIRACEARGDFGPRFVELARSVYRSNDRRSSIKRRINEVSGRRSSRRSCIARTRALRPGGQLPEPLGSGGQRPEVRNSPHPLPLSQS